MCENRTMDLRGSWQEIGGRIREARTVFGWTQAELAGRLGMDRSALVRVEAGDRKLDALELFQISVLFGLPLSHFVRESPLAAVSRRTPLGDTVSDSARTSWLLDAELSAHATDAAWLADAGLLPDDRNWIREASSEAEARAVAVELRGHLGLEPDEPLGPMTAVCEQAGLYLLSVRRGDGGASLSVDTYGVAVTGVGADPGRRRSTAAHELGHHVMGDAYSSDLGLTDLDDAERMVDAFAAELLVPSAHLEQVLDGVTRDRQREVLVKVAAEFRVSWSLAVRSAKRVAEVDEQRLLASPPLAADFLLLPGGEPRSDLEAGETGPAWRSATLRAYEQGLIAADRAIELLHGVITVDELPSVDHAVA